MHTLLIIATVLYFSTNGMDTGAFLLLASGIALVILFPALIVFLAVFSIGALVSVLFLDWLGAKLWGTK